MDTRQINEQHKSVCRLVAEKRIRQSLDILENMISMAMSGQFRDEYENLNLTYRNIVKYTIEGVRDPERERIYNNLRRSILNLADRVKQDILSYYSGWYTYWLRQQIEKEHRLSGKSFPESVNDLIFRQDLDDWLKASAPADPESDYLKKHKSIINSIFNHLWLTDTYGEAEENLCVSIRDSGRFQWHEACIFVSAVTLSLFRFWQPEKVLILADFYNKGDDQVKGRALAGIVLGLHYYNNRLELYPEITEKIKKMSRKTAFREHCRILVLQAVRSRETEALSRRLNEEILPKVASLKPRLDEKLDLDNILPLGKDDDRNPDWSRIFEGQDEIFKTMEELTNLQMEGADVYMSAFANLKHFDFFRDLHNWFVPFYPDHEAVDVIYNDEVLGPGINELAEALYKTPFICNSDKYSLLLNLKNLPSAQKSMMLKVFRMELEGLGQMGSEDAGTDPYKTFRINVTQYLQDMYRFFKLSPYKKDFEDVFTGRLDIYNSFFFRLACPGSESELSLADYLFSKDYFDDALEIYLRQLEQKPDDSLLYEKAGYCYQQAGLYDEALGFYRKADLISSKVWTIKKIGYCLRKLGRYSESLEYYRQAAEMEPDNIHTEIMIAHCCLDLKDYDRALKHYFRVEYNEPGNLKVLRPIAWCYFALGKIEDAEKYLERIPADKLTGYDYINKGHLALCRGQKQEAAGYYRQAVATHNIGMQELVKIFNEDREILTSNGADAGDFPILLDYLFYIAG
ncbi:MAG TPA: tetratricopeptide repeat protein [Bacteroidales bacterium]|nr:tetratricopeptide repeat protein [Bacteroidales bacterium]HRR93663.1 tetratricopeptide repeat protein [Bacteroidales bacterium]HRT90355.1 tetratricopeptide repeat protein [Bacteroidales bacterium]